MKTKRSNYSKKSKKTIRKEKEKKRIKRKKIVIMSLSIVPIVIEIIDIFNKPYDLMSIIRILFEISIYVINI